MWRLDFPICWRARSIVRLRLAAGTTCRSTRVHWCAIEKVAIQYVETLPADTDDPAIRNTPLLTGCTVTGHGNDSGTIACSPTLDVETATPDPGNLAIAEIPLLIGSAMTLNDPHLCSVSYVAAKPCIRYCCRGRARCWFVHPSKARITRASRHEYLIMRFSVNSGYQPIPGP